MQAIVGVALRQRVPVIVLAAVMTIGGLLVGGVIAVDTLLAPFLSLAHLPATMGFSSRRQSHGGVPVSTPSEVA